MATRKSEVQKASNLRKRVRDGGKLKPEEKAWLDDYEAAKKKVGRPVGSTTKEPDDDELPEQANFEPAGDPDPVPNNWEPPDDLPSPPRIVMSDGGSKRSGGGDWREKYRDAEKGGTGREKTCVMLASYWLTALKNMEDSLRLAGIDPIIEAAALGPSIVLTVDELLPDHVEFSPRVVAVGGSTMLGVQRFMRRKEIAEAQAKTKERRDFNKWADNRSNSSSPPVDIASHPDFNRTRTDGQQGEPSPATPAQAETMAPSEPIAPTAPVTIPTRQAVKAASAVDPGDPDMVI